MLPYQVDHHLSTRWITFGNPSGAKGMAGRPIINGHGGAGPGGPSGAGAATRLIEPGETIQLCDVEGPGTIRHFWCSTPPLALALRSVIVRAWFDDQDHPSIESPLGDFMGVAHGKVVSYCSAAHSVGALGPFNLWLPMPFTNRARITLTNDGDHPTPFAFQLSCTLGDKHARDVGRLHCLFRRENPTTRGRDFELLPLRTGHGRFLGAVIGVRMLTDRPWTEGELKVYLDGDIELPTLCGGGTQSSLAPGIDLRPTPFLDRGRSLDQKPFTSLYRWHLLDPILWQKDVRVTIQPCSPNDEHRAGIADDWTTASFWYESVPSLRLPGLPDFEQRTANLLT